MHYSRGRGRCWKDTLHSPGSVQFSLVAQSCLTLCHPMNRSTPGPPSITNSRSLLKLMPIELGMPSSHLILCCPLLLLPSIPPSIIRPWPWTGFISQGLWLKCGLGVEGHCSEESYDLRPYLYYVSSHSSRSSLERGMCVFGGVAVLAKYGLSWGSSHATKDRHMWIAILMQHINMDELNKKWIPWTN